MRQKGIGCSLQDKPSETNKMELNVKATSALTSVGTDNFDMVVKQPFISSPGADWITRVSNADFSF